MDLTVIGGDLRSVYLVRRLLRDGHGVRCYGLEQAGLPESCNFPSLRDALENTQGVVLPIPAVEGDALRTPYGTQRVTVHEAAGALPEGVPVFAGAAGAELTGLCERRNIPLTDLLGIESLTMKNAALTAECAVGLLIGKLPFALLGAPVLVLGAGRIGRQLSARLRDLGAEVTVAARKAADRAWCRENGMSAANLYELQPLLKHFRLVVNTIPARVLNIELLGSLPHGAWLVELASKPGGFDPDLGEALGLSVISAGGLPGKFAPESAADAIAETIYSVIER